MGLEVLEALASFQDMVVQDEIRIRITFKCGYNRVLFADLPQLFTVRNAQTDDTDHKLINQILLNQSATYPHSSLRGAESLQKAIYVLNLWIDSFDPDATAAVVTLMDD
jgi:hypothetical protein